jgi:choline dehydrogenase-like flavoprotein
VTHSTCRGNRAVGVKYVDDTVGRSKNGIAETFLVQASCMIVVSAGAFGSPAILERYVIQHMIKVDSVYGS